jgi:hypothetical protein
MLTRGHNFKKGLEYKGYKVSFQRKSGWSDGYPINTTTVTVKW